MRTKFEKISLVVIGAVLGVTLSLNYPAVAEKETKPQSKKKHNYNMLTGIYHNKNIDDYELKKINDLSGLAHSLSLIKRNFIEKVATSSHIEDYDEKDSIEHELNKMHDLKKNEKNEDVPEISDVFKEKTLDKCIGFFNAIIISQMQFCVEYQLFK